MGESVVPQPDLVLGQAGLERFEVLAKREREELVAGVQ